MESHLFASLTTIPRPDSPIELVEEIGVLENTECTDPYKDKKTARSIISMESDAAEAIGDPDFVEKDQTLRLALKIDYITPVGVLPAFHGPILEPFYDFDAGTVQIDAIGPEDRVATAFVVAGDAAIDGIPVSGRGFRELLYSAQNRPNQDALNWPSLGIIEGSDTSSPTSQFRKLQRGDEIWTNGFIELGKLLVASDWYLETIDTDPSSLAIGEVTDPTDHSLTPGTVHNFTIPSSLPGRIGKMSVGLWLTGDDPYSANIKLIHPDGTELWLFQGSEITYGELPTVDLSQDLLGQGTADSDLFIVGDKGPSEYGTLLNPITVWPRVGSFFAQEGTPSGTFFNKLATGDWVLQIQVSGTTPILKHVALKFQMLEPAYARLNCFDPESTTDPDIKGFFEKGFGFQNAKKCNFTTMGSYVRNQAILVGKDGLTAIRVNDASRSEIGTRQMFESSGEFDDGDILGEVAAARVHERSRPVMLTDLQPENDVGQEGLPRLLFDYRPGNHVRGHAIRGKVEKAATARVMSATLKQTTSGVETTLDTQPTVADVSEIGDGGTA